jgi:hypothetical protein
MYILPELPRHRCPGTLTLYLLYIAPLLLSTAALQLFVILIAYYFGGHFLKTALLVKGLLVSISLLCSEHVTYTI